MVGETAEYLMNRLYRQDIHWQTWSVAQVKSVMTMVSIPCRGGLLQDADILFIRHPAHSVFTLQSNDCTERIMVPVDPLQSFVSAGEESLRIAQWRVRRQIAGGHENILIIRI
jgi:hypothetical protein